MIKDTKNWEKEFDEEFWFDMETGKWESVTYYEKNNDIMDYVKDFIRKLLSQARKERDDTAYAKGIIKERERIKKQMGKHNFPKIKKEWKKEIERQREDFDNAFQDAIDSGHPAKVVAWIQAKKLAGLMCDILKELEENEI